jgi:hypothetical protein
MARAIDLTSKYVAKVSNKDYKRVLAAGPWFAHVEKKNGDIYTVYAYRHTRRADGGYTTQKLHRFILGLTNPNIKGDHKDGNGLNNTRRNLRIATHAQNMRSSKLRKNNTTGFKGVYWHVKGKKWQVRITVDNKFMYLGLFANKQKAADTYDSAARKYHGKFAITNAMLRGKA